MIIKFIGRTYKNCSPSGAEQGALAADQSWQTTLTNAYSTVFSKASSIFSSLQAKLTGIINNPQGYSAPELAGMNAQTLNTAAANAKKAGQAIGEAAGTQTGAVPGVESGVEQAERSTANTSILNNMANEQVGITKASADLAQQNQQAAIKEEAALPGVFNPATQVGSEVSAANAAVGQQASVNQQQSQSWMGIVGGLADQAAGVATKAAFA